MSAFLSAVQVNSQVSQATLNGHTFIIPPGKSAVITGCLIFTSAASTTGCIYGIKIVHGTGANGNLIGSWSVEVAVSNEASAGGLRDGDSFNLSAGTTSTGEVTGTNSTSGNNSAALSAVIKIILQMPMPQFRLHFDQKSQARQ